GEGQGEAGAEPRLRGRRGHGLLGRGREAARAGGEEGAGNRHEGHQRSRSDRSQGREGDEGRDGGEFAVAAGQGQPHGRSNERWPVMIVEWGEVTGPQVALL